MSIETFPGFVESFSVDMITVGEVHPEHGGDAVALTLPRPCYRVCIGEYIVVAHITNDKGITDIKLVPQDTSYSPHRVA